MNRYLGFALLLGVILAVLIYVYGATTPAPRASVPSESETSTTTPVTRTVRLYYYDPSRDKDASGNVMCTRDGLVAVSREIASKTPIEDTLRLLLAGNVTEAERALGVTTEYPLSGLSLVSVALSGDGTLTLELRDPEGKTGGGSCRVAILFAQIDATARQFPEVSSVRFIPDDLFQP